MATDNYGPYLALLAVIVFLAVIILAVFNVVWTPRGLNTGPQYGSYGAMSMFVTQARYIFYGLLQLFLLVPLAVWSWGVVAWSHFTGNWRIYAFFAVVTGVSVGVTHSENQILRAIDDIYNCGVDTALKDFVAPIANATAELFDVGICWYDSAWAIMFSSVTIGTRELVDCGEQIDWRDVLDKATQVPIVTARAWDDWVNRLIDNREDPAVDVDAAITVEAAANATATIVPAADCLCQDVDFIWDGFQMILNSSNLKYAIDNGTNVITSSIRTTIRSITFEAGRPVHMFMPSADRLNRTLFHTGAWFDDIDKFAFDIFACTFAETVGNIDQLDARLQKFFNISNCRDVEAPRLWTAYYSWWGIWAYVAEIFADTIFHIDEVFEDPILYLAELDITPPFDQAQFTAQQIDNIFKVNVFQCEDCVAAQAVGGVASHTFNASTLFWKAVAQITQHYFNLTAGDPSDFVRDLPQVYIFAQNYDYGPVNNELRAICSDFNFLGAQIEPHLGASFGNFCSGGVLLFNATWSIVLNVTGVFEDADFLLSLPVDQAAFEINVGWQQLAEFFYSGAKNSTQCLKDFLSGETNNGVLPANFFCCLGTLVDGLGEALTDGLLFIWNVAIDVVEITDCVTQIIACRISPEACLPGFCRTTQDLDNIVLPALMELREILYNQTTPPPDTPRGGIMPAITRAADSIGCLTALPFSRVPCPSDLFHDGNVQGDKWMFDSVADMTSEFLNLTNIVLNTVNVTIDLAIIFFEVEITDITFCQNGQGGNTNSLECNLIRVFGQLLSGTIDPMFNSIRAMSRFLGCMVGKQVQQVLDFLANTLQEIVDASTSNILQMIFNVFAAIYDLVTLNLSNFVCDLKALVGEVFAFIEQLGCAIPIVADIINWIFNLISCEIGKAFCSSMCVADKVPLLDKLVNFALGGICKCDPTRWKACDQKPCSSTFTGTDCLASSSGDSSRQRRAEVRESIIHHLFGDTAERYTSDDFTEKQQARAISSGLHNDGFTPCDVHLRSLAPHFDRAYASIESGVRLNHSAAVEFMDIHNTHEALEYALAVVSKGDELHMAELRDCTTRYTASLLLNHIGLLGSQPLVAPDFFYNFRRPFQALGELTVGIPMLLEHEWDRVPQGEHSKHEQAKHLLGNAPLDYVFHQGGVTDPTARAVLTIIDFFFRDASATIWDDGTPRLKTEPTESGLPEGVVEDKYYWSRMSHVKRWYVPTDEETHARGLRTTEEGIKHLMKSTFEPEKGLRTLQAYQLLITGAHTRQASHRRYKIWSLYNRVQERIAWHYLHPREKLRVAMQEMESRYEKQLQQIQREPRDARGHVVRDLNAEELGFSKRNALTDHDEPSGCANFSCGFDCCENCKLVEKIVNFAIDTWCDCLEYARFGTICDDDDSETTTTITTTTTTTTTTTNSSTSSSSSSEDWRRRKRDTYKFTHSGDFNWVVLAKRREGEELMWPPPLIEPPPPRVGKRWTWHDIRLHDNAIKNYIEHGYNPPDLVHEHFNAYGVKEHERRWYHPQRPIQGSRQSLGRQRRGNTYDADQEPYCCGFTAEPIPGETSISNVNFSANALVLQGVEAFLNVAYQIIRHILVETGAIPASTAENLALVAAIDSAATWIVNTNTEEDAVDEEGEIVGFGLFASYAFYYGCDYKDNLRCRDQGHGLFPDGALWVTGAFLIGTAVIQLMFPTFNWVIPYAWILWPGTMWLVAYGISPSCFPTIPACLAEDINNQVQTMTGDCINWETVLPDLAIPGTGECGVCNHPKQFVDCNQLGFNDAFGMLFFLIQWIAPGVNNYLRTTSAPWFAWVTDIPAFNRKLEIFTFEGDPPPILLSCFKYGLVSGQWSVLIWYGLVGGFASTLLLYIFIYTLIILSEILTALILMLIFFIDASTGGNDEVERPNEEQIVRQERALAESNRTGVISPAQEQLELRTAVSEPATPYLVPTTSRGHVGEQIRDGFLRMRRMDLRPRPLLDGASLPSDVEVEFPDDSDSDSEFEEFYYFTDSDTESDSGDDRDETEPNYYSDSELEFEFENHHQYEGERRSSPSQGHITEYTPILPAQQQSRQQRLRRRTHRAPGLVPRK